MSIFLANHHPHHQFFTLIEPRKIKIFDKSLLLLLQDITLTTSCFVKEGFCRPEFCTFIQTSFPFNIQFTHQRCFLNNAFQSPAPVTQKQRCNINRLQLVNVCVCKPLPASYASVFVLPATRFGKTPTPQTSAVVLVLVFVSLSLPFAKYSSKSLQNSESLTIKYLN